VCCQCSQNPLDLRHFRGGEPRLTFVNVVVPTLSEARERNLALARSSRACDCAGHLAGEVSKNLILAVGRVRLLVNEGAQI
jgi:hypothetical protein